MHALGRFTLALSNTMPQFIVIPVPKYDTLFKTQKHGKNMLLLIIPVYLFEKYLEYEKAKRAKPLRNSQTCISTVFSIVCQSVATTVSFYRMPWLDPILKSSELLHPSRFGENMFALEVVSLSISTKHDIM